MRVSVAALLKQPIGTSVQYEIAEDPIDPQGENAALLELGAQRLDAVIDATHTDPGILLEGHAKSVLAAECSRCLGPVGALVQAEFAEQYFALNDVVTGAGRPDVPQDVATIGADFKVDLTTLVAEELILATPMAPLCRPDCKGLCEVCGEDLNRRPHTHGDAADARWAALRALRLPREDGE